MNSIAQKLNEMTLTDAKTALKNCCASQAWIKAMAEAIPFADDEKVFKTATRCAADLTRGDWLEAFEAHPRIGDVESLKAKFASTKKWAGNEQANVAHADDETVTRLAEMNQRYFERFGFIFIVYANGKTANEMLSLLASRIDNEPEEELNIASAEQLAITRLRLRKLVDEESE